MTTGRGGTRTTVRWALLCLLAFGVLGMPGIWATLRRRRPVDRDRFRR